MPQQAVSRVRRISSSALSVSGLWSTARPQILEVSDRMAESPDAAELIAKVREEFPGLAFSDARLMNRGEDHFVFVLDGEWCSDFPVPKHTGPAFGTSCGSL